MSVCRLYIEAVGLSQANSKAKSVLQYRDPNRQRGTTAAAPAGDFATVLEREILQGYCPSKFSEWTIKDVNDWLDKLSSAADNADKKKELIKQVIFNLSARENKWLVRIILKDLKIGLRHEKVRSLLFSGACIYCDRSFISNVCEFSCCHFCILMLLRFTTTILICVNLPKMTKFAIRKNEYFPPFHWGSRFTQCFASVKI